MAIKVSYVITGFLIGIPLLLIAIKSHGHKFIHVLLAILFFIAAIVFREMDSREVWLPMGTHFLWHAFTGFSAYFILLYLFAFRKLEINNS